MTSESSPRSLLIFWFFFLAICYSCRCRIQWSEVVSDLFQSNKPEVLLSLGACCHNRWAYAIIFIVKYMTFVIISLSFKIYRFITELRNHSKWMRINWFTFQRALFSRRTTTKLFQFEMNLWLILKKIPCAHINTQNAWYRGGEKKCLNKRV